MPRIPLLGGAYSQPSFIAGAQRSVNLYPEMNPEAAQAPVQVTHYPRPGLTPAGLAAGNGAGSPPNPGRGRCLYPATNGDLYAAVDQSIYFIDRDERFHFVGTLLVPASTPVYMADNGTNIVVVDGSPNGAQINMATRAFNLIADPNFLGADRVDFIDYFLIFNQPNSPNWYSTQVNSVSFNALAFGTKTAWPDNISTLIATERTVWIMGPQKGEVWNNAGTIPFAFQAISGNIVEQGIAGKYCIARSDAAIYWLSQAPEGARMVMKSAGGGAQRISTHAIEKEFLGYPRVDDCIAVTYQIRGHPFLLLHFPTADRTWCFDEATQQWHEEAFYDINGVQHRTRDTFMAYAYGKNYSLDWATGQLYVRDETNISDNGTPIVFIRSFPHIVDDEDDRITLWRVIADMECGNGPGVEVATTGSPWSLGFSNGFGPRILIEPPQITLRVSRDRGKTFVVHSSQPMGAQGRYNERPTFNRCGYGFDMVIELSWAGPMHSALNGVFAIVEKHEADE